MLERRCAPKKYNINILVFPFSVISNIQFQLARKNSRRIYTTLLSSYNWLKFLFM